MSFDAGSIIGTLELDRDPFNAGVEQAKADQEELESNPITVTIRVDSGEADADIAQFQASEDELEAEPIVVQIDADATNGQAALAAFAAQGDELEAQPLVVPLTVNVAEGQATLLGFEAQADDLDAQPIVVDLVVNPGEGEAALAAFSAELAGIETEAGAVDLTPLAAQVEDLTGALDQLDAPGRGGLSGLVGGAQDADIAVGDLSPTLESAAGAAALLALGLDDLAATDATVSAGLGAITGVAAGLSAGLDETSGALTDTDLATTGLTGALGVLAPVAEVAAGSLDTLAGSADDAAGSLTLLDTSAAAAGLAGLISQAGAAAVGLDDIADADEDVTAGFSALSGLTNGLADDLGTAGAAVDGVSQAMDTAQISVLSVIDAAEEAGLTFDSLDELANQLGLDLSAGTVAADEFADALGIALSNAAGVATSGIVAMTGAAENVLPWIEGVDYSLEGAALQASLFAAGATQAEQAAFGFGGALNGVAGAAEDANAAVGGGGGGLFAGLQGLGSAMEGDGEGLGIMQVAIGGLVLALVAAIPALGAFIGEIGALAAIGFTAFAGLGGFILGAIGDFGKLETAAKTALTGYEDALKPLVSPVVDSAIPLITDALKGLLPVAASAAGAIQGVIRELNTDMSSSGFERFILWVSANTGPAISAISSFAIDVVKSLATMGEEGQPFIDMIERGLDQFGQDLDHFAASNTFRDFVTWLVTEGPVIGGDLESIGKSFGQIFVGLSPAGIALLSVFKTTMSALVPIFDVLGKIGSIPVIDGLAVAVGAALVVVPLLGSALTALTGAISSAGLAIFTTLLPAIGELAVVAAPIVAVLGAVAIGFHLAGESAAAATSQANAFLDGVTTETATTVPQLTAKLADLHQKMAQLQGDYNDGKISLGAMGTAATELQTAIAQTQSQLNNFSNNLTTLELSSGLSASGVEALAKTAGIDLYNALNPAQIRQFNAALQTQATQAGLTAAAFAAMSKVDGDAFSKMVADGNAAATAAKTNWASYGDAITNFSSSTLPPTATAIAQFYAESELQGAAFSQNVQKAILAGYSPSLISSIIQAGPAQAAQLLQGLVNAQGSGLQQLINQATAAMTAEGEQAVQEARLTAEAVNAPTSAIAAALPTALALSQALTTSNAAAQVAAVAKGLTGGLPELLSVATEYGITLPTALLAQVTTAGTAGQAQGNAASQGIAQSTATVHAAAQEGAAALPGAFIASIQATQEAAALQTGAAAQAIIHSGGSVSSATTQVMDDAKSAANYEADGFKGAGTAATQAIADGIGANQIVLHSATERAMGAAQSSAIADVPSEGWGAVGTAIASEIAGGIAGGSGILQAAVSALAGKTVLSGKSAVNAPAAAAPASPSYLDYGSFVGPSGESFGALAARAGAPVTITASPSITIAVAGNADASTVAQMEAAATRVLQTHVANLVAEMAAT